MKSILWFSRHNIEVDALSGLQEQYGPIRIGAHINASIDSIHQSVSFNVYQDNTLLPEKKIGSLIDLIHKHDLAVVVLPPDLLIELLQTSKTPILIQKLKRTLHEDGKSVSMKHDKWMELESFHGQYKYF